MEILTVPLDMLVEDPANPRSHPPENISAIRASLRRFGQVLPILVREADCQVVAGNGTLVAMRELGWAECKAAIYDGDSDECTALSVALNQTATLGVWNEANLAKAVGELRAGGFDGMGALGFDGAALDDLTEQFQGDAVTVSTVDPNAEWQGMPAYEHEDKVFRSLVVHFKDQEALDAFEGLVGCKLTEKTKFIWYPEIEIETYVDKRYESES